MTVTKRKTGWGVYAQHSGINKALSGPRRKEDQICDYISNWLQQGSESSVHHSPEAKESTMQNPQDPAAAIWATSMLHAHIDELTELNAIDVDGFIYVTATHADTLYSIERVYQSLHLAKHDLLLWIKSCSNRNTSAHGPRHSGNAHGRDFSMRRTEQHSYDDTTRRPGSMGRAAGPGCKGLSKPPGKKPASMERQMLDILSKKCSHLTADLAAAQGDCRKLERRCEKLAGRIANGAIPEPFTTNREKGGCSGIDMFGDSECTGYSKKELKKTIFNHVNAVMSTVHGLTGGDAIKALQLSDRVQQRARGQLPDRSAHDKKYVDNVMCVGVFESLKDFLNELSSRYKTKAPNDVRHVMQTIVTAIMAHFDSSSQQYLATKLEINKAWLSGGKARALTFHEEGLLDSIAESREAEHHSNRIPNRWRQYCHDHWLANCRAGEKMRDKLRNPADRSDKELYTVHFRENTISDLHKRCLKEGGEKWPEREASSGDEYDVASPEEFFELIRMNKGFKLSERIYRDCKPFQIKMASRDQCMCIWHLRFEYLAEGLHNYWKDRREKGNVKCKCPHLKTGTDLRRHCVCQRAEGCDTDKIECINQVCRHCRDLKRLQICDGCLSSFKGHDIKYQIYGKREYVRKRGRAAVDPDFTLFESRQAGNVETKPDFILVETDFTTFLDYLLEYWPIYIQHHDLSKHQDRDWERQRTCFPRGTFVSTQDYSENYHHEAKKEYQSAYFVEIGSTVYGMVIRVHLADIGTEAELAARGMDPVVTDAERVQLEALFEQLGEPAILTISHIVMSSDLLHDAAMVQHCNDKVLMPWMERIKAGGVKWVRHHARSDGCKAQFKCGTQFLWISSNHERHGTSLEWNFFCSCHGKDISGTCFPLSYMTALYDCAI